MSDITVLEHPDLGARFRITEIASDQPTGDDGADVIVGLTGTPKTLPARYFYDDRGSERHREDQGHREPEDVEERKRGEEDLLAGHELRHPHDELLRLPREVRMREHRALRPPRRSARVLKGGQVLRGGR